MNKKSIVLILIVACFVCLSCVTSGVTPPTVEQEAYTEKQPTSISRNSINEPTETPQQTPKVPIAIVIVNSANIRSGPGTNYDAIGYAVKDAGFMIIGRDESESWYNIVLDRYKNGWIAASVVDSFYTETLAVSATIPAPPIRSEPLQQQLVCNCGGDSYNCSSFSRQSQAQSCYNYCVQQNAGDIHGLDRDGDGRVCESLP